MSSSSGHSQRIMMDSNAIAIMLIFVGKTEGRQLTGKR